MIGSRPVSEKATLSQIKPDLGSQIVNMTWMYHIANERLTSQDPPDSLWGRLNVSENVKSGRFFWGGRSFFRVSN